MKILLVYSLLFISFFSFSQEKRIISYDLVNRIVDTIDLVEFDASISKDRTMSFSGGSDDNFNILETTAPGADLFPGTQFSLRKRAEPDYDINAYPIRTSVWLCIL
ncbi:MAG: hypothetical protein LBQ22_10895 [Bacteroidales bacterium]|jgi:hypothetical protein|nr:hypothetical protein [Bacteroidales bacterium]